MADRMVEWQEWREWWNGGQTEWWNGGMAEWRNGGMAEWRNGGMAGMATGMMGMWLPTYYYFMVHTNACVGIVLKRESILKIAHYHGGAKRQV